MATKTCAACGQTFQPHHKVPNQTYCSSPDCQKERRQSWDRKQQKKSGQKWLSPQSARTRRNPRKHAVVGKKKPTPKGWFFLYWWRTVDCLSPKFLSQIAMESNAAGRCVFGSNLRDRRCNFVSHRPVTALPFVPHFQQRRVTGIHEINDAHISFCGVLTVQATGVLLKRPPP